MLEWIDSHTHLESEFPFSTDEYISNAKAQGVTRFITIGNEPHTLQELRMNAEKYPEVYFTVGVHPHEAKDFNETVEKEMLGLQSHQKCLAVGEIGLDYFYDHSPREVQQKAFERQLDLALLWNKPVVIHARDAEEDLLIRLKNYSAQSKRQGVIHCFSGTQNFADECIKMGFYISFSGILTFKKADDLRAIAKTIPVDKLLIETDSPFLAPLPYRGKPNQSAYMIETAKILAQVKGISLGELSRFTVENTKKLFGF